MAENRQERLYQYSKRLLCAGFVNEARENFKKLGSYKDSAFLSSLAGCNYYRLPSDIKEADHITDTYITALEMCLLDGGDCREAARILESLEGEYRLTKYIRKAGAQSNHSEESPEKQSNAQPEKRRGLFRRNKSLEEERPVRNFFR